MNDQLRKANHRPRRCWGQHFLRDAGIIRRVVDLIDPRSDQTLLEIGPGSGALTTPVARRAGVIIAVEIDRKLAARLDDSAQLRDKVRVVCHDLLQLDLRTLLPQLGPELRVFGSLPYSTSVPMVFHLLRYAEHIRDMHLVVQREVAERMCAPPRCRAYGRLSVMLQCRCRVSALLQLPSASFHPSPRVESTLVKIEPHTDPGRKVDDPERLGLLVGLAFGQRRKKIRNSLRQAIESGLLLRQGIDPNLRAEDLSVADYCRLSRAV